MLFLILPFIPSAQALTPTARWGHRAAYIEDKQSVYIVGGAISNDGTQITNEVLVLPLNSSSPAWSLGPDAGLPAHAFASMAQAGSNLVVVGGLTSSCANDKVAHSLNLGSSSPSWSSGTPGSLRRRHGAVAAGMSNKVYVVGGLSDSKTCGSSTIAYTAVDELAIPVTSSSAVDTVALPNSLTGTQLAVSDFALAQTSDKLYLAGGQSADGSLVNYNQIGVWSAGKWTSQTVRGDVPAGRLGATLVAHPTLDVLVLHGGSEYDSSSKKYSPLSGVAVLNTTSWQWSKPSNLQQSTAVAYHSSVMIPSGVMVSAFGMGSQGVPVNNVAYLDMRDSSPSSWAWKTQWDQSMLTVNTPSAPQEGASHKSNNKGTIAAAVVPTVIGVLILLPLCLFLWRRHQRNQRKRRLASHYSFEAQEDGHFNRGFNPFNFNNRHNQAPYPFARDDSTEKDGSWTSGMRNKIVGVFRRGSAGHGVGDDGTIASREMVQTSPSELHEKGMNWEEIDFGLGRVDENRREATYTDLPARRAVPRVSVPRRDSFNGDGEAMPIPFPMPIASTMYKEEIEGEGDVPTGDLVSIDSHGSPRNDGQSPLAPAAATPLAQPATNSPLSAAAEDAAKADAQAADWEALEASLSSKPAFRAISPTATLGSHSHDAPASSAHSTGSHSDASYSTAPSLPPLDFTSTSTKRPSIAAVGHNRTASGPRALTGPNSQHARRASAASVGTLGLSPVGQRLHVVNGEDK